jgi:DNA-binding transcriptional LysR family regulator
MDKLNAIQGFLKIVDAGSITAAARALDVSQPSMVRLLAALENDLGARLLNRTTRRMSLTDEGRIYYERARQIVAAVEDAQMSLSARRVTPSGRLKIASSVAFGRAFVAPVVAQFLVAHAQVTVELILLDRIVDLIEEGVDISVRIAELPDSSLVARTIGAAHRMVVASPAFLRAHGTPREPADLSRYRCVSFTGVVSSAHWDFADRRKRVQVPIKSAFVTNQVDAGVLACVDGVGIGRFSDYHVQQEIRAGRLKRVLQAFESEPIPASIVYPSSRQQSANVREFVAFAQPRMTTLLREAQLPRARTRTS